jgi:hypothetical protein
MKVAVYAMAEETFVDVADDLSPSSTRSTKGGGSTPPSAI